MYPVLVYDLEACPLNKSQLVSLDFVINRFFMKLFNINPGLFEPRKSENACSFDE